MNTVTHMIGGYKCVAVIEAGLLAASGQDNGFACNSAHQSFEARGVRIFRCDPLALSRGWKRHWIVAISFSDPYGSIGRGVLVAEFQLTVGKKEIQMNKRTTTRATLIATAVMTLLTTSFHAHAMPIPGLQVAPMSSWFFELWPLLRDSFRCSRCHDRTT